MTAEWDVRTSDPALLRAPARRGRASATVLPVS